MKLRRSAKVPLASAARDQTSQRWYRIEDEVEISSSAQVKVDGKICDDKAEAVSDKNDSQCAFWLAGIEGGRLRKLPIWVSLHSCCFSDLTHVSFEGVEDRSIDQEFDVFVALDLVTRVMRSERNECFSHIASVVQDIAFAPGST